MSSRALLTIDCGAIAHNYNKLRTIAAPGCQMAAVIKADAYGLGLDAIAKTLEAQNCPFYFVATAEEGMWLRALTAQPIAILNGIIGSDPRDYDHHRLIPVLNSLGEIAAWRASSSGPAIVHFDTGMSRLGLGPAETEIFCADPGALSLAGIMSHFSSADDADDPLNAQQYEAFQRIAAYFPGVPRSLANSSALFRSADYHADLARPGMALYGLNPTPEKQNPMRPVLSLQAGILQVRTARRGDTIGYNATARLAHDTTLATIGLGYADGFMRSLGNRGVVYYQGRACPIVGRISMDLTVIDMGRHVPQPGDVVDILGPQQDADTLAAAAGTIGYEMLTALGQCCARRYL